MTFITRNILRIFFTGWLWLGFSALGAQSAFPVDSSFTLRRELTKQLKHHPDIHPAEVGDTSMLSLHRDVVYTSYGQRQLHADIVFLSERAVEKMPVILFVHGGGWSSGNKSMEHPLAFEMARRGYAAVCVEYRLSPEAGYPAAVIDLVTAIKWVRAMADTYPFDPEKVVLEGTSAGAQLVSLLGSINNQSDLFTTPKYAAYSGEVQGVINIDGVLAFLHPDSSEGMDRPGKPSAATRWLGSTAHENPERWKEASALTHINKNSAPFLFINSSLPRFGAGRDDLIEQLNKYDIPSRKHQHESCPHTFWLFHPWFETTVQWMDDFMQEIILL